MAWLTLELYMVASCMCGVAAAADVPAIAELRAASMALADRPAEWRVGGALGLPCGDALNGRCCCPARPLPGRGATGDPTPPVLYKPREPGAAPPRPLPGRLPLPPLPLPEASPAPPPRPPPLWPMLELGGPNFALAGRRLPPGGLSAAAGGARGAPPPWGDARAPTEAEAGRTGEAATPVRVCTCALAARAPLCGGDVGAAA